VVQPDIITRTSPATTQATKIRKLQSREFSQHRISDFSWWPM